MALNFPDSPTAGTVFGAWRYDGTKWGAVSGVSGGGGAGDITAVLAGVGLSGGGTEGDVSIALTVPVTVARGGTGATDATTALTNLGAAPIASPTLTGDPKAPTPATADNDTSIATTAYVKAQGYLTPPVNLTSQVTGVLPVANGGTGSATVGAAPWVEVTGDTMTGDLALNHAGVSTLGITSSDSDANISLSAAVNQSVNLYGYTGGTARWLLRLGTGASADFQLIRHDNAGAVIDAPISIAKATGQATFLQNATFSQGITSAGTIGLPSNYALYYGGGQCYIQWNTGTSYMRYTQASGDLEHYVGAGRNFYSRHADGVFLAERNAVAGNGAYINLASFRGLKSNIRAIPDASDRLKKLKPVSYTFDATGEAQHGFVIEDLLEAYPEAVKHHPETGEPEGYSDAPIIAGLAAALQEALTRIEQLEAKIGV